MFAASFVIGHVFVFVGLAGCKAMKLETGRVKECWPHEALMKEQQTYGEDTVYKDSARV